MKVKVYFVCDWHDEKAKSIEGTPNVGVEYLGNCMGRAIREDGEELGYHYSSTFDFLRSDLTYHLGKHGPIDTFEIIDLIGQPVPDRFKKAANA
jgi:hypothetical protein